MANAGDYVVSLGLDMNPLETALPKARKKVETALDNIPTVGIDNFLSKISGLIKKTVDPIEGAFKTLGIASQESLNKMAQDAQQAFERIRTSGTASAEDLIRAQNAVDKAIKATTDDLGNEAKKIESSWGKIGSTVKNAASEMQSAGIAISASVTAPIIAAGVAVAKTGAEFETSINIIGAQSSEASARLNEFSAKAIQLGADLSLPKTSANDAAAAMLELSKSGLSVNDTLDAAKATLLLAQAATIGEADAAKITAVSLQQFGLAGTQTAKVVDLLAASASASSLEITDVANSLKYVGPIAKDMGISINETVTAITELAKAGIKGEQAGTSLRGIMADLNPTSKQAKAAMDALGVSIFDANHKMLPFKDVINNMHEALGKLTDQSRQQALATIFGKEQMTAASVIFGQGAQVFAELEQEVSRAGVAQEQAGARSKGLAGAVEALKSQVETVALAFSALTNGPLEATVRNLADLVPNVALAAVEFAQANPQVVAFGVAIAGVTAVVGPLLLGLGSVVAFIGGPFTIALVAAIGTVSALVYAYITDTNQLRTQTIGLVDDLTKAWQSMGLSSSDAFTAITFAIGTFVDAVAGPITALIGGLRILVQEGQRAAYALVAAFKASQGDLVGVYDAIAKTAKIGSENTKKASVDGLGGLADGWGYRLNEVRTMLVNANGQYASLGLQAGNNYVNGVRRAMASLPGLTAQAPAQGFADKAKGAFNFGNLSPTTNRLSQFTQEQIHDQQILGKEALNTAAKLNTAFGSAAGGAKHAAGATKELLDNFKTGFAGFTDALNFLKDKVSTLDALFDPMSKKARQNSQETIDALKSVSGAVNGFLTSQGINAKVSNEEVAKMFSTGNTALIGYTQEWQRSNEIINQAGIEMAERLHAPLKAVNETLKASGSNIQLSAEMWANLTEANKQNFEAISEVTAAQKAYNIEVKNSSELIQNTTDAIVNHIPNQKNALYLYQMGLLTFHEFTAMLHDGVEPAIDAVGASADLTGQKVGKFLDQLKANLLQTNGAFAKLKEDNDIAQFTDGVIREFEDMAQHLNKTTSETTDYVLKNIQSVLGKMPPEMRTIAEQSVRNWVDGLNQLPGSLDNIINKLMDSLGKLDAGARAKFKGTIGGIIEVASNIPGAIGDKLNSATNVFITWVNKIDSVLHGLHKIFGSVSDGLAPLIQSIFKSLNIGGSSQSASTGNAFSSVISKGIDLWNSQWSGAKTVASKSSKSLVDDVTKNAGKFNSAIGLMGGALAGFTTAMSVTASTGSKAMGGLIGGLTGAFSGFLAGGMKGSALGPHGAILGSIIGGSISLLGSLFGSGKSKAQKEAEEQAKQKASLDLEKTAQDIANAAMDGLKKGLEVLEGIADFANIPDKQFNQFMNAYESTIKRVIAFAGTIKAESLTAAKSFGESVQPIAESLNSMVQFYASLPGVAIPVKEKINQFISAMVDTVSILSTKLEEAAIIGTKGAAKWAVRVKDIVGMLSDSATAFNAISSSLSVPIEKLRSFVESVKVTVQLIKDAADWHDLYGVKAAAKYAERSKAMMELLTSTATAFDAVGKSGGANAATIKTFISGLKDVVIEFVAMAATLPDLTASASVTSALKSIVDVFAPAVTGLNALPNYSKVAREQMALFTDDLMAMAGLMSEAVKNAPMDMLNAAADFSEKMKPVVELFAPAVTGLTALKGTSKLGISEAQGFIANLVTIANLISVATQTVSTEMLAKASDFATKMKPVIDLIAPALDGFKRLREEGAKAIDDLSGFKSNVTLIAQSIIDLNSSFDSESLAGAARFSDIAKRIFEFVSTAVSAFQGVSGLNWSVLQSFSTVETAIGLALNKFISLAASFPADTLTTVADFLSTTLNITSAIASIGAFFKGYEPAGDAISIINSDFDKISSWMESAESQASTWRTKAENFQSYVMQMISALKGGFGSLSSIAGGLNVSAGSLALEGAGGASLPSGVPLPARPSSAGAQSRASSGGDVVNIHIHNHGSVLMQKEFEDSVSTVLVSLKRKGYK